MARKSWRPYRIVYRGESFEVNADAFDEALRDNHIKRCEKDRRRGYVRLDLVMFRDAHTARPRFAVREPAAYDPAGVPSWWPKLVGRAEVYFGRPDTGLYEQWDQAFAR
jgi:hypothetical protein